MNKNEGIPLSSASFPTPFGDALEYTSPARGMWNIVHVGMLIPCSHQIFVCAGGCLRGVVLTAAEMGAEERFSTVSIEEAETIDGSIEENLVAGIEDVIDRLETKPRAILVYTSCIHEFLSVDLSHCYALLRARHPALSFADCYMTPIKRKSGMTPDEKMRTQLYSLIEKGGEDDGVSFLGDVTPLSQKCGIARACRESGRLFRELPGMKSWEEYQSLGSSRTFLYANSAAAKGAREVASRLGRKLLYLPYSFNVETIRENREKLREEFHIPLEGEGEWESALRVAREVSRGFSFVVDYTATSRPLSLVRLLLDSGFDVSRLYLEAFSAEEEEDFRYVRKKGADIRVLKSSSLSLPFRRPKEEVENVVAIGQKCAYAEHTSHFVNLIADGGHWGFEAIENLAAEIISAVRERKDTESIITVKGWGCRG